MDVHSRSGCSTKVPATGTAISDFKTVAWSIVGLDLERDDATPSNKCQSFQVGQLLANWPATPPPWLLGRLGTGSRGSQNILGQRWSPAKWPQ